MFAIDGIAVPPTSEAGAFRVTGDAGINERDWEERRQGGRMRSGAPRNRPQEGHAQRIHTANTQPLIGRGDANGSGSSRKNQDDPEPCHPRNNPAGQQAYQPVSHQTPTHKSSPFSSPLWRMPIVFGRLLESMLRANLPAPP